MIDKKLKKMRKLLKVMIYNFRIKRKRAYRTIIKIISLIETLRIKIISCC